jgi:hypothetical protein
VWGQALPFPFSLACSLGVLIFVFFWNQFNSVGRDLRPFLFLTCMFPWGFDLVFWNQFSVGSGSALLLSFSLAACSLGVLILCF